MKITRTSHLTGITRTMDLPVTEDQMLRYNRGALTQNAFPHLSPADREFIISGITSEEWDAHFKSTDNE